MKENLIDSAKQLVQPAITTAEEFSTKRETIVATCNSIFSSRSDLEHLVGLNNLQMAQDNNHNFSRFMGAIFTDYQPDILVQTVLWVFRTYRAHGFKTTYWAANLNIWMETLQSELSPESFREISPFYNWLIIHIPVFTALTETDDHLTSPSMSIEDPH